MRFSDRSEAGRQLAQALEHYRGEDVVVLALVRGGLPVAAEIATHLRAPLDLVLVRKIGVPWHRELAMGAVVNAQKPIVVREEDVIALAHVSEAEFEAACEREIAEIERRGDVYFGARAPLDIANRIVIVVDDGIATGSTIRAAVAGIKERQPTKIVVAIPVASPKAVAALRGEVDEVCCLLLPSQMDAIGCFYEDFPQLDDDDVVRVLAAADASNERG
ncbi:phosphoribosyltransferase [Ensifer sp. SL37]|uniref:phosphoribosyltransferase n=1 Tax=Ensifer sp. SL37 TaxID=2995137 RepID=UPI0022757A7D|nr:phosphoribosyltransferase family protein [Ensifer sp. SL37]MCY1746290.1 phosphoribosyltransferase family protein [Ensifer sp. SL37]